MQEKSIPHEKCIDATLDLLREGYLFINSRVNKYKSDIFKTHIFLERVICISGKESAELFYNEEFFIRKKAMPKRIQKTLTGVNGVQGMDGKAHKDHKSLFVSLVDGDKPKELADIVFDIWQKRALEWEKVSEVNVFNESKKVLCEAACRFTGVPISNEELEEKANDFALMVAAFGAVGIKYWKGKMARKRTETWIKSIIQKVRDNELEVSLDTALYIIANHKEANGILLDANIAAIELINIIRPIVAISTYITFMALALYKYPKHKIKLIKENDKDLELFVQEVRRYYPFTPFVGARVKKDFIWKNCIFIKGSLVLLDVYGINHDSRIWNNPHKFNPERFRNWEFNPYEFIPHGGGPLMGHKCPGEVITVEIMKTTLNFLVNQITFNVPKQNLNYNMTKIPTLPKSGFIIDNIKIVNN